MADVSGRVWRSRSGGGILGSLGLGNFTATSGDGVGSAAYIPTLSSVLESAPPFGAGAGAPHLNASTSSGLWQGAATMGTDAGSSSQLPSNEIDLLLNRPVDDVARGWECFVYDARPGSLISRFVLGRFRKRDVALVGMSIQQLCTGRDSDKPYDGDDGQVFICILIFVDITYHAHLTTC